MHRRKHRHYETVTSHIIAATHHYGTFSTNTLHCALKNQQGQKAKVGSQSSDKHYNYVTFR